jgi:hypothetical protein
MLQTPRTHNNLLFFSHGSSGSANTPQCYMYIKIACRVLPYAVTKLFIYNLKQVLCCHRDQILIDAGFEGIKRVRA